MVSKEEKQEFAAKVSKMSHSELVEKAVETLLRWQADDGLAWQAKLLAKRLKECDDIAPIMACESLGFDSSVTWAEVAKQVFAAED